MRDNIRLGIILAIITSITGLLLGFVHESTKAAIVENSRINKEQMSLVMPNADNVSKLDLSFDKESIIQEVMEAKSENEVIGYIIKLNAKGFHGNIGMLVGVSKDEKITGINIVSHSETPGVGSKVEKQDFTSRFKEKNIKDILKVVKTVPAKDNEVEGISGASISSAAVTQGVNDAVDYFKANLAAKGGN
jgi:Na+-translocating ferredoxin:NAD+ oxidoreductase subunit G